MTTFAQFKEQILPSRIGLYDPACFASLHSYRAFVLERTQASRSSFLAAGTMPLVFTVYCTRDPSTQRREPAVYQVGPPPLDMEPTDQLKNMMCALARSTAMFGGAVCTVFTSEVWVLSADAVGESEARRLRETRAAIDKHPLRSESLLLTVEHGTWPTATAVAPIRRPAHGLELGEWKISYDAPMSYFRFANTLPVPKGTGDA